MATNHRFKLFFENSQVISSSGTVGYDDDEHTYQPLTTATTTTLSHQSSLPYTAIYDNTEGVSAYADIEFPQAVLAVDIGGGPSDTIKSWVEQNTKIKTLLVADPYHRSTEHNELVEKALEEHNGADLVTSMSVLNVLQQRSDINDHVSLLHRILKDGGTAYFKVWAGFWPQRGSGSEKLDLEREVYQANQWASFFLPAIALVFGSNNCFCDMNQNMIIARKLKSYCQQQ
jgi:hypothetical protein